MNPKSKTGLTPYERWGYRFFQKLFEEPLETPDEYHLLNEIEVQKIDLIQRKALFWAMTYGSLGVLALYLPSYFLPHLFLDIPLKLPFWGQLSFPLSFSIYGIILAIIEISALMHLNIQVVHKIARACAFPNTQDPLYQEHLQALFEVSLEKPDKDILAFGINPFQGLSVVSIRMLTLLNILKASLSNIFVKVVLARVLGRFAVRSYIDLVGIPIFAFWNMYTCRRVIREAKVRVMAPSLIDRLVGQMHQKIGENEDFKEVLYDSMQFIAMAKRSFHYNHFLLFGQLIKTFEVEVRPQKALNRSELLQKIRSLKKMTRLEMARLFIFGMLIDGRLSSREARVLSQLSQKEQLFELDFKALKTWERSFLQGQGMEGLFEAEKKGLSIGDGPE